MPPRPLLRATLVLSLVLSLPAAAQEERVPGSRLLSFGVSAGIEASDNPDLEEDGQAEIEATTGLSVGLISLTPRERFELGTDLGLAARAGGRPEADSFAVTDPSGSILYSRSSRASQLTLSGEFAIDELTTANPLELLQDDLVDLEDEEELQDLIAANGASRDARRLTFGLDASLETRRGAPFGVTYDLGLSGVRYSDAPEAFEEKTRLEGGLGLRFDLTGITQATANLDAVTSLEGEEDDRLSLGFGINQNRPFGNLGASLGLVDDNGDLRTSLSLNGALERPTATLSGAIGVTRADSGDLALIGSTSFAQELSRTQRLRFDLSRQVTQLNDPDPAKPDRERAITSLQASYDYDITRLWRLGLNARYTRAALLAGPQEIDTYGQIGAQISRALTETLALNLGIQHRFETNADGTDPTSNTISLSLSRSVRIPY